MKTKAITEQLKKVLVEKLKIKYIKATALHMLEGNPRQEKKPDGKERLKLLIKKHGFRRPLEIYKEKDGSYSIICGNHAYEAGLELEMTEFPCTIYQGTRAEALARAISDNESSNWTEWAYPELKSMVAEIDTGGYDIEHTGFIDEELKGMFDYEKDELKEIKDIKIDNEIKRDMEVISFLIPKLLKSEIERNIEYITDGEAIIKKFPSTEINLGQFISKNNIPKRKINEDEAFYAFVMLSYFNFLKSGSGNKDRLYKFDFIGTFDQIKKISFVISERIKQYDTIPRNAKMIALMDLFYDK